MHGSRLLTHADVKAVIVKKQAEQAASADLSQGWILTQLRTNVERALQATPVYDAEGEPTGEYRYDGAVANKGLELLGKHLGMFNPTKHVELEISIQTRQIVSVVYQIAGRYVPVEMAADFMRELDAATGGIIEGEAEE